MTQPKTLDDALQTRNMPRTVDEWEDLLDSDGTHAVETEVGEMAFVEDGGQLHLHYAFDTLEAMKQVWHSMFEVLRPRILDLGYPYLVIDLVEHPNRRWIEGLLDENDFEQLGDWLEFTHNDIRNLDPPEIPTGLTMRRGNEDDHEAVIDLEGRAYGDFTDGATATRNRLAEAAWLGVLERDGELIAYALNSAVEEGAGTVISCAVQPREQNRGIGKVILGAATYQLASAGSRTAAVRVWPEIPRGARIAQAIGYRVGRRGIELRRDSDEAVLEQHREEQRIRNMRVRFG
ncbi:MAG: GNAT family N-acetyltransferase, partial [Chloroflexi bacterium]|nr:GNAT family N-acetyltransferase [Chloroflexota bacterium]